MREGRSGIELLSLSSLSTIPASIKEKQGQYRDNRDASLQSAISADDKVGLSVIKVRSSNSTNTSQQPAPHYRETVNQLNKQEHIANTLWSAATGKNGSSPRK